MKRNLLIMALIVLGLSAYNCGGGGAGTANVPTGENPSLPSVLQLQPVQYVAQTGSYIYLKAKVLDGNGMPVTNYAVTFTNLSVSGVLSPKAAPKAGSGRPADSSGAVTATTDSLGVATATLYSTAQGFVTVQASVATTTSPAAPAAQIISKKTVYYSSYYMQCQDSAGIYIYGDGCTQSTGGTTVSSTPYILLYVDGNNNATYNESSDQTLFETPSDDQVKVLATVYDGAGGYVKNTTVTFSADSTEVTFPMGSTATTDSNGQAYVLATVTPSVTRTVSTVVNVTASTSGGAAGLVSLYLSPVTISSLSVTATPTIVAQSGTASIIAAVKTSTGQPAPDGTSVSFAATCGYLGTNYQIDTPFAQTTNGAATCNFIAPTTDITCTITALSGGFTASTTIQVYTAVTTPTVTPDTLSISPGAVTVASAAGAQQVTFSITGGYTPYTTTSTDPTKAYDSASGDGIWSGSTVLVNIPANVAAGAVTLNVYDSKGTTDTASLTIIASAGGAAGALAVSPAAITLAGIAGASAADNVTFSITGGTAPYSMYSSNSAVIANGGALGAGVSTFTVNPTAVSASTAVTLTVMDALGTIKTVIATVTPATGSLSINPATLAVKTGAASFTFSIIGGSNNGYTVVSGNQTYVTINGAASATLAGGTNTFTVGITAVAPGAATSVTITVIDTGGGGTSATSTVTVNP